MSVYWLDFEEDEGETLRGRDGSERLGWDLFSLSAPVEAGAQDDSPRPELACCVRPGLSASQRIEVVGIIVAAAFVALMIGFACGWRW